MTKRGTALLQVHVEPEIKKELYLRAIENDKTISDVIRELIEKFLSAKNGGK